MNIYFITGNQSKADYLAKYLDHPIEHKKLDLDEIQSLDLSEIVEHKVRQAYDLIKQPVLVEDVSLEFTALGKLPGPFIKFFLQELSLQEVCDLLGNNSRAAIGRFLFAYYDAKRLEFFEGEIRGTIATHPEGIKGFGWDPIFIPDGYKTTRALLNDEDYQDVYLKIRPFAQLKAFLEQQS
jgi:non-canonical purine NTP pyrophosphatase (RdgB/HAM1 family)